MIAVVKRIDTFLIIMFLGHFSWGQGNWVFLDSIKMPHQKLYCLTDGKILALDNGVLFQCVPDNEAIMSYSERTAGNIFSADISDPLNILVFFKDFGYFRFVDKQLSPRSELYKFSQWALPNADLVCNAPGVGIWMLSEDLGNLFWLDLKNNRPHVVNLALNGIYLSSPQSLVYSDRHVFLADNAQGIFIFDVFGTFLTRIPVVDFEAFTVVGTSILIVDDERLKIYNFKLHSESVILLPQKNVCSLCMTKKHLILGNGQYVYWYKVDEQMIGD